MDNQRQGHTVSSQLTRDARKSFRRRANIKLVCVAGPTSQSLNQMIRNAVASCYSGCPNAEAVAGEMPSIPAVEKICRSQSVKIARDRGCPLARRNKGPAGALISPYGELCHQSVNCAERGPSQTNMDVAALTERILFRSFYLNTEASWRLVRIHCDVSH